MNELGFNLPVLIAQLVNFFLLLVILRIFLYKPVLEMLDRRTQRIREGLDAAEQSKEQATQAEAEVSRQLEQSRAQGQALIGQAQEAATRIQEEARNQARTEGDAILERARREIQLERDQAIAELRAQFGELTVEAAEKVIGQSLDRAAHRRLIEETLAASKFREN